MLVTFDHFAATIDKDVPMMCKVFSFFQAGDYLVHFLEENKVFKRFPAGDLIQLGLEYGIPLMKDAVESSLIKNFVKKLPVTTKKSDETGDFDFDDLIINYLDLVVDHELPKLKENIEARLSADYTRSNHLLAVEDKYVQLIEKYQLEELKKLVEPYAIDLFNRKPNKSAEILNRYAKAVKPLQMNDLTARIEEFLLNKLRGTELTLGAYDDQLNQAHEHDMVNLKDYLEGRLLNILKEKAVLGLSRWERMSKKDNYATKWQFNRLLKIFRYSESYALMKLKSHIKKLFIDGLFNFTPYQQKKYLALTQLKKALEKLLINEFQNDKKMNKYTIQRYFGYTRLNNLDKYKKAVEEYMINALTRNVEEVEAETILRYFTYSVKNAFNDYKKHFEAYLINGFENNHDYKNIKFAFWKSGKQHNRRELSDIYFKQFNATVIEFLKTASIDVSYPFLEAVHKYIAKLSDREKAVILDVLLKKPEGE